MQVQILSATQKGVRMIRVVSFNATNRLEVDVPAVTMEKHTVDGSLSLFNADNEIVAIFEKHNWNVAFLVDQPMKLKVT